MRLLLALLALVLVLLAGALPARGSDRLEAALLARMTLHQRPDGTPIYVRHCRRARAGCEERVRQLSASFREAGRRFEVDPWLLAAMAVRESGLNPLAVGGVGEFGVLQLHPESRWGRAVARECRRAPSDCSHLVIMTAGDLLRRCEARCGSLAEALGLYNSGRCDGGEDYARRVLRTRQELLASGAG